MKKNILKSIVGVALATMTLGAAVGVAVSAPKGQAQEVRAVGPETAEEHYIDVSALSWWDSADAVTLIHMYKSNAEGSVDVPVTLVDEHFYKFSHPAGYDRLIVSRRLASSTSTWTDESWPVSYESGYNIYKLKNEKSEGKWGYDRSYVKKFESGQEFYVDAFQASSYWHSDSCDTYIYFAAGSYHDFVQCTRIGISNMYSVELTDTYYADNIVIVRGVGFDGEHWSEPYVYSQTTDILYTAANQASNAFKLGYTISGGEDNGKTSVAAMETLSDAFIADCYGYYFLQLPLCKDSGGMQTGYAAEWAKASSCYTSLKVLLVDDNYIKNSSNVGDSNINLAMKRYDTAVAKNADLKEDNFIGRAVISLGAIPFFNNSIMNEANNAWIWVVVSIMTAGLGVAAFFFIKRRKEDR